MLSIINLSKNFDNKKVLNNINLSVKKGEIALLLGASGVGKSTLLRVLNNLESAQTGTIMLDGAPLDLERVNTTHQIGMVFQQFNLFEHMTVEENITFPLIKAAGLTAHNAKICAHALLKKYNLDAQAHCFASQLSGGQKQRLAIARTLALKPQVVCLDEPTSALDPLLTNYVAASIQELAKEGYTVLVASHDTSLIDKLDCTIYLMDQGEIIETAPSEAFRAEPQKYSRIYNFVQGNKH